jgi:hypothetical protein
VLNSDGYGTMYGAAQAILDATAALVPGDSALAPFSDYGGWVDVGAPGQQIGPV